MPNLPRKCSNCDYYQLGRCFEQKPTPIVWQSLESASLEGKTRIKTEEIQWVRPVVAPDDYCSSYKQKS